MPAHQRVIEAGPGHPRVRQYLALSSARGARPPGCAALEGLGVIEAALAHGARLQTLLVCPERLRAGGAEMAARLGDRGVPVLRVSRKTFDRLTERDGPDGLAAIAVLELATLGDVALGPVARVLVLDRFELAGNVGSLVRCAAAAGVDAVLLVGGGVRLGHPVVVRASVGAVFSVPICATTEPVAIAWLRRHRVEVVAADPAATRSYRDATYRDRVAVVVGSERHGLSAGWRRAADQLLAIPMAGRVDSLNAGHAGALFLYEVVHRHGATP